LVREEVRAASDVGVDWRAVIDALRPVTQDIWQSLPPGERKRFLRHVRSYWEVHRHRIAPEIGDTIASLVRDRQVHVYAGRVTNYREYPDHVEVSVRDRKTRSPRLLLVDRVINCTGPETDCRRIDDPLMKSLLSQGFARPDSLLLGLDADSDGALINCSGVASHSLYAIGPARKGLLWETIAVPELRVQAAELAEHLVRKLPWQRRNVDGPSVDAANPGGDLSRPATKIKVTVGPASGMERRPTGWAGRWSLSRRTPGDRGRGLRHSSASDLGRHQPRNRALTIRAMAEREFVILAKPGEVS